MNSRFRQKSLQSSTRNRTAASRSSGPTLLALTVLLCACRAQHVLAQSQSVANLQVSHDSWGFREGAPETVAALAQTADGFLWLGSATGLVRFDGTRFEAFRSLWGDRLLATDVSALFAPRSGGLWIGYRFGGFSFLENGRVTNYRSEVSSPTGTVQVFAQRHDGMMWAGTSSGLWTFDGSRWQHLGVEWNAPVGWVRALASDARGNLWVLAGNSRELDLLYLLPGSQRFQFAEKHLHTHTLGFLTDASGTVVSRSRGQPLITGGGGNSISEHPDYPVIAEGSNYALIDRNHSLWKDNIDRKNETIWRIPSFKPGAELSPAVNAEKYHVDSVYGPPLTDREGDIWIGTGTGVHRFSYTRLIQTNVLKETGRFAVAADDDGAVWIGSSSGLLHSAPGGTHIVKEMEERDSLLNFAFAAPDKTFWLATTYGLWHFQGGKRAQVDVPPAVADQTQFLQAMTQDRTGGMWISFGRHGLYRLAGGVWTPYGGRDDLPKTGVVIEFTDRAGRIWFGCTNNQLAVLDGDRVQVFGASEGIRVGNITAIYGRGTEIWIGGEFGLQQFDHGQFHSITAIDDEWLRGISGIVETADADLWLYGLAGIFHIRRAEIAEALATPAHRVRGRHLGRRQGAPGLPAQIRPLPTAIEGSDGRLWFAGSDGVVWLDPTVPDESVPPPSVTLESVSADGKYYPTSLPLRFPAHTADVQFAYAAVSLSNPEGIRYRYKLEETDKEWTEVREPSPVTYRNLSPGSYHFSAAATDTDGVWSNQITTAAFAILPAFYQTAWFRTLCIAAALAALFVGYLLRVRHLAREFNLTLEARVSERTRIARELHDTLLQSFHGLLLRFRTVHSLFSTRPGEAQQILESAIDEAREALTEGRLAVQGLRSKPVDSHEFCEAMKTLGEELASNSEQESSVALSLNVEGTPRPLQPLVRDEIYRIGSEALRNAFRHAEASRIEVQLDYGKRRFELRVLDNGRGIDPRLLNVSALPGHFGLTGMRERATKIGGKLVIWSAPASGTELELSIPGRIAYGTIHPMRRSWLVKRFVRSVDLTDHE